MIGELNLPDAAIRGEKRQGNAGRARVWISWERGEKAYHTQKQSEYKEKHH